MLHLDPNDHYRSGSSRIHRLDPRIKILGALAFILTTTLLPPGAWVSFGLLLIAAISVARATGLGWGFALKRSFVALPFALAAITLPFTIKGQTIAHVGPLVLSAEGTIRFISILIKSWLSVQLALLLTATTPFHAVLGGMRELRIPSVLISIVGFMYRYLFVLGDEALRLMRARSARAATGAEGGKSGGSLLWRGQVAGGLVGNLTLRAFERSERIYDAMVARGFQGEIKTLAPPSLTSADTNILVGWVTFLGMCLLIGLVF